MTDKIIVYRSETAQRAEQGFYEIILPWLFDNWLWILAVGVIGWMYLTRYEYHSWLWHLREFRNNFTKQKRVR